MLEKIYKFHEKRKAFYSKHKVFYLIITLSNIFFWVFAFKSSVFDANNIPSGSMVPTLKIGDFLFVNKMRYTFKFPFTDTILFRMDKPSRGEIVTFKPPAAPGLHGKTLVKRIIGIPGDKVRVKNNEISINGSKYTTALQKNRAILKDVDYPARFGTKRSIEDFNLYKEKVLDPQTKNLRVEHYIMKLKRNDYFLEYDTLPSEWSIPPNKYMVMGDNRDDSQDSRQLGFIDIDNIHGKVFMIYFSMNWGYRLKPRAELDSGLFDKNPIFNFFQWILGKYPDAYVRWDRIGKRIY